MLHLPTKSLSYNEGLLASLGYENYSPAHCHTSRNYLLVTKTKLQFKTWVFGLVFLHAEHEQISVCSSCVLGPDGGSGSCLGVRGGGCASQPGAPCRTHRPASLIFGHSCLAPGGFDPYSSEVIFINIVLILSPSAFGQGLPRMACS